MDPTHTTRLLVLLALVLLLAAPSASADPWLVGCVDLNDGTVCV